jgi:hypothetical protein
MRTETERKKQKHAKSFIDTTSKDAAIIWDPTTVSLIEFQVLPSGTAGMA